MPDNDIGWGQGAVNNDIGWGKGAANNDISWGAIHADSPSGDTNLVGAGSFINTKSVDLDGIDEYIDVNVSSSSTVPSRSSSWTYSAWLYLNSTHPAAGCIFERGAAFPGAGILCAEGGGAIKVYFSGTLLNFASNPLPTNQWAHFALTYNISTNQVTCYINNSNQTLTAPAGWSVTGNHFNISRRQNNHPSYFWSGHMDEISTFNSELSSSTISTIFNSGVPNDVSSLNPISYWRFEAISGGEVADLGSDGNNAILKNGASLSTNVPS